MNFFINMGLGWAIVCFLYFANAYQLAYYEDVKSRKRLNRNGMIVCSVGALAAGVALVWRIV